MADSSLSLKPPTGLIRPTRRAVIDLQTGASISRHRRSCTSSSRHRVGNHILDAQLSEVTYKIVVRTLKFVH
jgi:hypothetical protein